MARGRKPTPTARKILAGNPGKRKLNKHEPQHKALASAAPSAPDLAGVDPPDWLDDRAKEAWRWYCPRLIKSRTLTDVDLHNLEAFCSAVSRWRMAEDEVARYGITVQSPQGGTVKNPAVTVINEALKQIATFGAALGLDPASRSRIKVPGGPTKNPFSAI